MLSNVAALEEDAMLSKNEMKYKLQSVLTNKRYLHTLGVAQEAVSLAKTHREDATEAEIAGLLHDCAKSIPNNLKLMLCREMHIPLNAAMQTNPELTHSFLGAEIAARDYGVIDPVILDAIRYHTTGRPAMGNIEKIVYLADFFEPNRKPFPSMEKMKKLAYADLDEAMIFALEQSLIYIKQKGLSVHELSEQALAYYKHR